MVLPAPATTTGNGGTCSRSALTVAGACPAAPPTSARPEAAAAIRESTEEIGDLPLAVRAPRPSITSTDDGKTQVYLY